MNPVSPMELILPLTLHLVLVPNLASGTDFQVFTPLQDLVYGGTEDQSLEVTHVNQCAGICAQKITCEGADVIPNLTDGLPYRCYLYGDIGPGPYSPQIGSVLLKKEDFTDDCASSPCLNGGSCTDMGPYYMCTCAATYVGTECQTVDLCQLSDPCQNGGSCLFDILTETSSCACPTHCSGVNCESCCNIDGLSGAVKTITVTNGGTPYNMDVFIEDSPAGDNWIVLMRRVDGSVDFVNKLWNDYKVGFGSLTTDFWLGNDNMHYLTGNGSTYTLRFDLRDWNGVCKYAEYSSFSVDSEALGYRLHISGYSGDAGDSMTDNSDVHTNHNNILFSTSDVDHDALSTINCAQDYFGGWWYTSCYYAKLTGPFGQYITEGIHWEAGFGYDQLMYADMKIRVN